MFIQIFPSYSFKYISIFIQMFSAHFLWARPQWHSRKQERQALDPTRSLHSKQTQRETDTSVSNRSPSVCQGAPVSVRKSQCLSGSPRVCQGAPVSIGQSQCLSGSPRVCQGAPVSVREPQGLSGSPRVCQEVPVSVRESQCLSGSPRVCQEIPGSIREPWCLSGSPSVKENNKAW